MGRGRITLALGLLALLGASSRDVDVAVPPGTPLEWTRSIPIPTPRPTPLIPTGGGSSGGDLRTVARPRGTVIPSTFSAIRILTWDLTTEVPWTPPMAERHTGTGSMGPWPPTITDGLYWMGQSVFLRVMLHPMLVSRAEAHYYLLEMGDPARKAALAAEAEPVLKAFAEAVKKDIGEPSRSRPIVPARADPYQAELTRFTVNELVARYPHDPSLTFARRLFALGSHGSAYVIPFVESKHALLRRNAVLAMGRYETAEAAARATRLINHADPVTRARALAILRARRHAPAVEALKKRLSKTKNVPERCALIHTLGVIGDASAAGPLTAIGRRYLKDGDILMAVLPALARIDPQATKSRRAAVEFVEKVQRAARSNPRTWDPKGPEPSRKADIADPAETRGRIIQQLCTLALVRLKAPDKGTHPMAAALLRALDEGKSKKDPRNQYAAKRGGWENLSLQAFEPPAYFLLIETLPALGDGGVRALEGIVEDTTVDPVLRATALARLSGETRDGKAVGLSAWNESTPTELKIFAFELLDSLSHPRVEAIAREILRQRLPCDTAINRYVTRAALRALARLGRLKIADLKDVMTRLTFKAEPGAAENDRQRIEALVAELIDAAVRDLGAEEGRRRMKRLLDTAISRGTNPGLNAGRRKAYERRILEQLKSLAVNKKDPRFVRTIHDGIVRTVMPSARPVRARGGEVTFDPQIPLGQEVVLELGRLRDAKALPLLEDVIRIGSPFYRAMAALALAASGKPEAARIVFPLLEDKDGYARFCAYEAMKRLTGESHFGYWIYGSAAQRRPAVEAYKKWLDEHE